jgi:hypothetical protein
VTYQRESLWQNHTKIKPDYTGECCTPLLRQYLRLFEFACNNLLLDDSNEDEGDSSSSGDCEIDAESCDNIIEHGDGPRKPATWEEILLCKF